MFALFPVYSETVNVAPKCQKMYSVPVAQNSAWLSTRTSETKISFTTQWNLYLKVLCQKSMKQNILLSRIC